MWKANSLEKTLMLGKTQGRRRRDSRGCDGWMASPTSGTCVWVNSGRWWWTGEAWRAAVHGVAKSWKWLVTKQQGQQRSKGTDTHSVAEDTQKPELLHSTGGDIRLCSHFGKQVVSSSKTLNSYIMLGDLTRYKHRDYKNTCPHKSLCRSVIYNTPN